MWAALWRWIGLALLSAASFWVSRWSGAAFPEVRGRSVGEELCCRRGRRWGCDILERALRFRYRNSSILFGERPRVAELAPGYSARSTDPPRRGGSR